MKLKDLIEGIRVFEKIHWDPHLRIEKITSDSRALEPGDVFVACRGTRMDGHDFLGQAMMAKAGVLIYEKTPELTIPKGIVGLRVGNSKAALADLLVRAYGSAHQKVKLIGVTGTNGKTTIAYLLHRLLREKKRTAYLGTLWYDLPQEKVSAQNTTPGPEVLIPLLDAMAEEKVSYCVMEVSSHALDQFRVHGLHYELGIFTQLTQDHLDYHKDMEHYFQAKRRLFCGTYEPHKMLINRDCPYGRRLLQEKPAARDFSLKDAAYYRACDIETSFRGSRFTFCFGERKVPFQIKLPMRHNIANVVSVLGALDLLGFDPEKFRGVLQEIPGIPGRLERITGAEGFDVFVDYAHTPDAIENVLSEAKRLQPKRILTLFGAGGDRDREKRPLMAKAASRYSDVLVLTSDNPRSEDPEAIVAELKRSIPAKDWASKRIEEVLDRCEAIDHLISLAEPGDVVFVLGKGHEGFQILGDKKIPLDDREVVRKSLKRKHRAFIS